MLATIARMQRPLSTNAEWQEWSPFQFWRRLVLTDGSAARAFGPLMRRKVDGQWQYRRLTEQEWTVRYYEHAGGISG
jgi:hypothetical protein